MAPGSRKPTVLIADGDPDSCAALMWCLLDQGICIVDPVNNGLDAAVSLENPGPPDLAIIDVGLPGLSGRRLIEAMRASDRFRSVPIIATGTEAPFGPGAPDIVFIPKPVRRVDLVAAIYVLGLESMFAFDQAKPTREPVRPSDLLTRLSSRSRSDA
jgi:CheY-like chemotaxis protein